MKGEIFSQFLVDHLPDRRPPFKNTFRKRARKLVHQVPVSEELASLLDDLTAAILNGSFGECVKARIAIEEYVHRVCEVRR